MRDAIKIMKQLILKGELYDRDDPELFELAMTDNIRDELNEYEEEWKCKLVYTMHRLYLVPLTDNEMFNVRLREIRNSISGSAKNIDAYLICYIIMVMLHMFFKSKNGDPQSTDSLRIRNIVETVDKRLSSDRNPKELESAQIGFTQISDKWNGSVILDEGRKSSKTEFVKTACRFLIKNELAMFADDEDEIRVKQKLSDLMRYYYLRDNRISEINAIFEKEDSYAGN